MLTIDKNFRRLKVTKIITDENENGDRQNFQR